MPDRKSPHSSRTRIVIMAMVAGLLCAASLGIESSSTASNSGNLNGTGTAQLKVVQNLSILGFMIGAPLGGIVGALWNSQGFVGALGFILVILTGGLAGMMVAALIGAETRVTISGNAVSMEHGATMPVLVVGAALGLIISGLCAWLLDHRSRP